MGNSISVPVVAPLDIEAILKAEKEAKRTRVFLLRNAGLPICPRRLPQMKSLREVDLSSNRIVELPFELGELHKIRILNVSHNLLSQLPHSLGDCVVLKTLNASSNTIEEIFPTIGQLQRIEEVDMSDNNLTAIEPTLSKCLALIYLNLGENNIEELPPELGDLKNIREMNVSFNRLTGIHQDIGLMRSIEKLDVRGNLITTIPSALLTDTMLDRLYTHDCPVQANHVLCSNMLCPHDSAQNVHAVLKQQVGYAAFHERKMERIKRQGWPPAPNPNRLKGWGEA